MRCEQIRDLLSSYIDGETTIEETIEIKEHLSECIECKKELEELKTVLSLFNTLEPIEPPEDLKYTIMAKVKSEGLKKSAFAFNSRRWIAWGATAAVIFIIVGTVGISSLLDNSAHMKSASGEAPVQTETAKDAIQEDAQDGKPEEEQAELVGIMELEGPEQEPSLLAQEKIDDEIKETRIFSAQGSRGLDTGACQNAQGEVQEELFKEVFTVSVKDLDNSINNIVELLGASAVVNKYQREAKIIGWKEKSDNTSVIEKIKELVSLEFEDNYVTNCLEEFSNLQLEKEMLVDTLNQQTYGYEHSLNIQRELEIIEWQIENMNVLEIDKVVFYEITVIEME